MEDVRRFLDERIDSLDNASELRATLESLVSIYPFNQYEFIIAHLLAAQKLSLEKYLELRATYIADNKYLLLFEMSSPRGFGETWAQQYLIALAPNLMKASRKLDPAYDGEYDLFLAPTIRIEVKASRVVALDQDAPLYVKALSTNSIGPFDMNFQQIKPRCCDVLIWLAVWRDAIYIWVLASAEVERSPYFSKGQHRGNTGEGQLHITRENIQAFDQYLVAEDALEEAILAAFEHEQRSRLASTDEKGED